MANVYSPFGISASVYPLFEHNQYSAYNSQSRSFIFREIHTFGPWCTCHVYSHRLSVFKCSYKSVHVLSRNHDTCGIFLLADIFPMRTRCESASKHILDGIMVVGHEHVNRGMQHIARHSCRQNSRGGTSRVRYDHIPIVHGISHQLRFQCHEKAS